MSSKGSGSGNDTPIIMQGGQGVIEPPKGLLDAISELEYFHALELKGANIDEKLFTTKNSLLMMELGFRATFLSELVMALLTPVSIGVIQKMIPVFGSAEPTPFDELFVLMLSLSFLVGHAYFIGYGATRFYSGYTRSIVKNLLQGVFWAAVLKVIIVVILFPLLYVQILSEKNILWLISKLTTFFPVAKLAGPYQWLLEFRSVFPTSAVFVAVTTVLYLAVIFGCYFYALKRNAKLREAGVIPS